MVMACFDEWMTGFNWECDLYRFPLSVPLIRFLVPMAFLITRFCTGCWSGLNHFRLVHSTWIHLIPSLHVLSKRWNAVASRRVNNSSNWKGRGAESWLTTSDSNSPFQESFWIGKMSNAMCFMLCVSCPVLNCLSRHYFFGLPEWSIRAKCIAPANRNDQFNGFDGSIECSLDILPEIIKIVRFSFE